MKISLILTTYNGSKYIVPLINSIFSQTRRPDEVLIFDDCSSDNTISLINKFIEENHLENTWKCEINSENKGYEKNFFDGMCLAKGDIVFFCDQDDIWYKNKISKCMEIFESINNVSVLCTDNDFLIQKSGKKKSNNKKTLNLKKIYRHAPYSQNQIEKVEFSADNFYHKASGCDIAIKKTYLDKIKQYWTVGFAQDEFTWKFALASNELYFYHILGLTRRIHENNTSRMNGKNKYRNRMGRIEHLGDIRFQLESLLLFCKDNNYEKSYDILINKNIKCLKLRIEFLKRKNIFVFILLLFKYLGYYPRKLGIILDFLVAYFGGLL